MSPKWMFAVTFLMLFLNMCAHIIEGSQLGGDDLAFIQSFTMYTPTEIVSNDLINGVINFGAGALSFIFLGLPKMIAWYYPTIFYGGWSLFQYFFLWPLSAAFLWGIYTTMKS